MWDGDAAGETGGRLSFAGHRRGDEAVAVGGASCGGESLGEQADDGLLVAAGVDVEGDQVGGDDGHLATFLLGLWVGGCGRNRIHPNGFEIDLSGGR